MKTAVAMIALVLQAPVSMMRGVLSLVDDVLKVIESKLNCVINWADSDAKNKRNNGYEA